MLGLNEVGEMRAQARHIAEENFKFENAQSIMLLRILIHGSLLEKWIV